MSTYQEHLHAVTRAIVGIGNEGVNIWEIGVVDGVIVSIFPNEAQHGFVRIHRFSTVEQKKGLTAITWAQIEARIRLLMRKGILS